MIGQGRKEFRTAEISRLERMRESLRTGVFHDEFGRHCFFGVAIGRNGKPGGYEPPLKYKCERCGQLYGTNGCPNCGIGPV